MNEEQTLNAVMSDGLREPSVLSPTSEGEVANQDPLGQMQTGPQANMGLEPVKEVVTNDFRKIDGMIAQGRLSLQDGAELKNYVLEKAFGNRIKTQAGRANEPSDSAISQAIRAHESNNPGFFSGEQRRILKDYLLNNASELDLEGLGEITRIVEALENSAVQRLLSDETKKAELLKLNQEAKSRMQSNITSSGMSKAVGNRRFTRAEISKMSTQEFLEHEKEIMSQLKNNLL